MDLSALLIPPEQQARPSNRFGGLRWLLFLATAGCFATSSYLLWLYFQEEKQIQVTITPTQIPLPTQIIHIDISGAVLKPGVYQLQSGTRVFDAVRRAEGFKETANKQWVQQELNLAAELRDGQKIYIPFEGETGLNSREKTQIKDINTASVAELDTIKGIGLKTAEKIIQYREDKGTIETFEELLEIEGIGESNVSTLKYYFTGSEE